MYKKEEEIKHTRKRKLRDSITCLEKKRAQRKKRSVVPDCSVSIEKERKRASTSNILVFD
jgi:hypothetical protein